MESGTEMGPVISRRQLERVTGYIRSGQEEGATLFAGGGTVGERGFFVQPTVLTDVKPGMAVHDEEIFGPVLCAMSFNDNDLDRIIATANETTTRSRCTPRSRPWRSISTCNRCGCDKSQQESAA